MAEHIVAVFKSEEAAAAAEQGLQNAGVPRSVIRRYTVSAASPSQVVPAGQTSAHTSGSGFWSWLFGEESTSQTTRSAYDHDAYDRMVAAGNVVVDAMVDDAKVYEAITVLEAYDPVEFGEGSDGVTEDMTTSSMAPPTGASTVGRDFSSSEIAQARPADTAAPSGRVSTATAPVASGTTSETSSVPIGTSPAASGIPSMTAASSMGTTGADKGEQVMPLAEEQLQVGKRTVDRGTTRIRRYVVEKPVEEDVTLRSERVMVERRRPLETTAAPGPGAFEERVVEVRETAEEPVVAKTAQVVEEVVVGREATERTETVKDTVRREEIEVTKDGVVKR